MRKCGELVQWNNKSGFGFVRDDSGRDFYVHISKVVPGQRPRVGDRLEFEIGKGRNGRPSALAVSVIQTVPTPTPTLKEIARITPGSSSFRLGLRLAVATGLALLALLAVATGRAPIWLAFGYTLMGVFSAALYRFDKLYALEGRYRVSETNLHVVDLAGGIIGGLAAQELYRHKTVKPSFVGTTWVIALLHLLGLAVLALGPFQLA
jgi:uncharacterized membrane protein YsdA (DUF1294 family)/cold shock CspA family protein